MPDLARHRAQGSTALRLATVGLLGVGAVALIVYNRAFRDFEAYVCRPVVGLFTGGTRTLTTQDVVYFGLGTSHGFGLRITSECTSSILLVPLFLIIAALVAFGSFSVRRVVLATVLGVALILITNVLRIGVIAFSSWAWGVHPGYTISHVVVGSLLALAGFAFAVMVALRVLVGRGGGGHSVPPSGGAMA